MSNTTKIVEQVIQANASSGPNNDQLKALEEFIVEMIKAGVIKKPTYTIPQIDTLGRGFYNQRTTFNTK